MDPIKENLDNIKALILKINDTHKNLSNKNQNFIKDVIKEFNKKLESITKDVTHANSNHDTNKENIDKINKTLEEYKKTLESIKNNITDNYAFKVDLNNYVSTTNFDNKINNIKEEIYNRILNVKLKNLDIRK